MQRNTNERETQACDSEREARILAALEGLRADVMELRAEVLAMQAQQIRAAERSRLHMAAVSQLVADTLSPGPAPEREDQ